MRILILIFSLLFIQPVFSQELPEKNKKIIAFAEKNKGKKLGKGECWDLAAEALDEAEATWKKPYEFGKLLGKKETVLPGDIIQLENVKIVHEDGSGQMFPHHTAIIFKVLAPGKYIFAEQNNDRKRYVIFSEVDLNDVKKGKFMIYRPQ